MTDSAAAGKPSGRIIRAPHELKGKAVRPGNASLAALEAISRAEAALEELSVNFRDWMGEEVERLGHARAALRAGPVSPETVDALFHAAHDLKGQGSTLGYPAAAEVCASLCRLIEAFAGKDALPMEIVDHHVDAVAAIFREGASGADNATANALSERLKALAQDCIDRSRPSRGGAAA